MFQAGVALAIIGVVWAVWPQGNGRYSSTYRIGRSTYHHGPMVMVDRGHWNRSNADSRFDNLVQLLTWDGYQVSRNRQKFVPDLLRGTWVLIVGDALGWQGALRPAGLHLRANAFSADEVAVVRSWVERGGSLLLIADSAPAGEASQSLASAFGVRLADTPVAAMRLDPMGPIGEDVPSALSFGGGTVAGPPGSTTFLASQGIAFQSGMGRVAVLTAQLAGSGRFDNRPLMLNIMHWLSRAN